MLMYALGFSLMLLDALKCPSIKMPFLFDKQLVDSEVLQSSWMLFNAFVCSSMLPESYVWAKVWHLSIWASKCLSVCVSECLSIWAFEHLSQNSFWLCLTVRSQNSFWLRESFLDGTWLTLKVCSQKQFWLRLTVCSKNSFRLCESFLDNTWLTLKVPTRIDSDFAWLRAARIHFDFMNPCGWHLVDSKSRGFDAQMLRCLKLIVV